MKSVNYTRLVGSDRSIAHMAAMARCDTVFGGALALVYAKRLDRMQRAINYRSIVSDVYSASTGRHSADYEGWECPECGSPHLGQGAAMDCCADDGREAL